MDYAEDWMELLRRNTNAAYGGAFKVGVTWLGGVHFVRPHALFKDLPTGGALDWPYQAIVRNGNERTGFLLEGEELVVGARHSYPMRLGTAVGVIPAGEGESSSREVLDQHDAALRLLRLHIEGHSPDVQARPVIHELSEVRRVASPPETSVG